MDQNHSPSSMANWQALYEDKAALVESPDGHQFALNELAEALRAQGLIDAGTLSDMLEQADAAYQWGVEEQISRELNHPVQN